jgi:hypothetical protein
MPSSGMLRRVDLVRTGVLGSLVPASSGWQDSVNYEQRSVRRLLVTASVVPNSPILAILMMGALGSSEMSAFTKATRRNIPEDSFLPSHLRRSLESYIALTGWTL